MLSIPFSQKFPFRLAGHSFHSSVSLIKTDCLLHNIEHLTTQHNHFSNESILEQFVATVHVLISETQWVPLPYQLFNTALQYDFLNWLKTKFRHRGGQCSNLSSQYTFRTFLLKWKCCFLNTLHISWESVVASQLPFGCRDVSWTNESRKQITTTFCTNLPRKETGSTERKCHLTMAKKGKNLLIWKGHVTMTKKVKNLLFRKNHVTKTKKNAYERNSF